MQAAAVILALVLVLTLAAIAATFAILWAAARWEERRRHT
jgi:hypothetical protein